MNACNNRNDKEYWQDRIVAKLFNYGVYKEKYTKEKALLVINRCVGATFLRKIFEEGEQSIIDNLLSETQVTY